MCVCVCVCVREREREREREIIEMIDCWESESMIVACRKLDKSNTLLHFRCNILSVLFHGTNSESGRFMSFSKTVLV